MKKILTVVILLSCIACSPLRQLTNETLYLKMEKTSCMGACPVYLLSIYNSGHIILNARENLALEGYYISRLSTEQWNELQKLVEKTDLFALQNEYTSTYSDLPTTYITYRKEGRTKYIKDYDGAPEELDILESQLHDLIGELSWKKTKKSAGQNRQADL